MSHMDNRHPDTELIAYLKNELAEPARETVTRHLDGCAECRDTLTAFRTLLDGVAATAAPPVQWARYRAELRLRREAAAARRAWWRRPMPIAMSAGLAAAMVALVIVAPSVWREEQRARSTDEAVQPEEVVLGTRLDLLRQYPVVERLDLLEDLDVIRQLDGLTDRREG